MELTESDKQILGALNEGKVSIAKEIAPSLTPPENEKLTRKHINKLLADGYAKTLRYGQYGITEKGREVISPQKKTKNLSAVYPPLAHIPNIHYRAFVELIYAAVVARNDEIRSDHHSVFIIAGRPRETWKTRLGWFVCHSLGLDPEKHIAYLPAESGRSLFTRKDSSGGTTFIREVLNAPFVVLDEFLEADKKVRDILRLYTSANLFISYENEILKLAPVPLITMNPLEKKSLDDRLGVKSSELARSIVLYADNIVDLSVDEFASKSENILASAKTEQITPLPKFKVNCERYRDEIIQLVRTCREQSSEFGKSLTSYESIIQLCSGMTAFVDDAETAIKITLHDLFTVQETTGWSKKNWQSVIDNFSLQQTHTRLYEDKLVVESIQERVKDLEGEVSGFRQVISDFPDMRNVPAQLQKLLETIEYFGEIMQKNCPFREVHNDRRYCMAFCSEEKPDEYAIPDVYREVDGVEHHRWYPEATYLLCGLCPKAALKI